MKAASVVIAGRPSVSARAKLRAVPFPCVAVKACLRRVPLADEREFAQIASMEILPPEPVLISPGQRYELLAEIVDSLRARIDGLGLVIVLLTGSEFLIPLPASLLSDSVALTHDPQPLLARMLAEGQSNLVCISQWLRSDGFVPGDNTIEVALWAATSPAREAFLAVATPEGLFRRFESLEVRVDG
jgi:hypothetical protein